MNVLAFDTCLGGVSVAVRWQGARGEWLSCDRFELREGGHAERLMPMIAEVMEEAGLAFADLERIAVTVGPGTFTGVRGGVAAARGLALASGVAVVGATSLAVMAHGADELLGPRNEQLLAVAVDARRGMVYLQLFADAQDRTSQPLLLAPEEVAALVGAKPVTVVGSGAGRLPAPLWRPAARPKRASPTCSRMPARWRCWPQTSPPSAPCGRSICGRPTSSRKPTSP